MARPPKKEQDLKTIKEIIRISPRTLKRAWKNDQKLFRENLKAFANNGFLELNQDE